MNISSGTPSRFACPTSALNLDFLLGQLRKTLWLSVGLAVLVHLAVVRNNPCAKTVARNDGRLPNSLSMSLSGL